MDASSRLLTVACCNRASRTLIGAMLCWRQRLELEHSAMSTKVPYGTAMRERMVVIALSCAADIREMQSGLCSCKHGGLRDVTYLCLLAATWKGRAVAVKVMLASHGEHAGELESFRQEVRIVVPETVHASQLRCPAHGYPWSVTSAAYAIACTCICPPERSFYPTCACPPEPFH